VSCFSYVIARLPLAKEGKQKETKEEDREQEKAIK